MRSSCAGWCNKFQIGATAPNCSALILSNMLWPTIMARPTMAICPARQADECCKRDHRRADREDHLNNEVVEFETESPAKTDDGELDQHQPAAAREQVVANLTN